MTQNVDRETVVSRLLAADDLVDVFNALALIRLRRLLASYLRRKFAHHLLVDSLDDNFVLCGNHDCDTLRRVHINLMRKADVQNERFPLQRRSVADTVDFKLLDIALCHAVNHVLDQRTRKAMKRAVLLLVRAARNKDFPVFDADLHIRMKMLRKHSLRAFHLQRMSV